MDGYPDEWPGCWRARCVVAMIPVSKTVGWHEQVDVDMVVVWKPQWDWAAWCLEGEFNGVSIQ